NNVEQVRLSVDLGGKAYSFQTAGFANNMSIKFNKVTITEKDLKNPKKVIEAMAKDAGWGNGGKTRVRTIGNLSIVPTRAEWKNMTKLQKHQYLVAARYLLEDVNKVLKISNKKKGAAAENTRDDA